MSGDELVKVDQFAMAPVGQNYSAQMQIASFEEAKKVSSMMLAATDDKHENHKHAKNTILILAGLEMGMSPIRATQELFIDPRSGKVGQYVAATRNEIARDPRYEYVVKKTTDDTSVVMYYIRNDAEGKSVPEIPYGKWVACNGGEPLVRDRKWAIAQGKFTAPKWVNNKMVEGNTNYQRWLAHPQNMLLWQNLRDGAKFFFKGLFNGAPIIDEIEVQEINEAPENNYPVTNLAHEVAQERATAAGAEDVSEVEPTKFDNVEAAEIYAEKTGDTGPLETAKAEAELEYVNDKSIQSLMTAGASKGWTPIKVIAYCKDEFKGKPGFDTEKPLKLTTALYDQAKRFVSENAP